MRPIVLLLGTLFAGGVQAEICLSPPVDLGAESPPGASTVFNCGPSLSGSINALAQSGYEIVSLKPIVVSSNPYRTANQLLIQKANAVFTSSFE